jgi:hypothetical protein
MRVVEAQPPLENEVLRNIDDLSISIVRSTRVWWPHMGAFRGIAPILISYLRSCLKSLDSSITHQLHRNSQTRHPNPTTPIANEHPPSPYPSPQKKNESIMNCLFYAACFLALLQSALAMPTLAPRADQVAASHKGQSDEKCYFGCGFNSYPFGSAYLTNYMYPYFNRNYLYGGLDYNLAYMNSYGANFGIGANVGLFKKDASEANKHQENSVCLGSFLLVLVLLKNWIGELV